MATVVPPWPRPHLRLIPDEDVEFGVQVDGEEVVVMAARGRAGERDARRTAEVWAEDKPHTRYRVVSRVTTTPWRGA
jgi:hypothetical protein